MPRLVRVHRSRRAKCTSCAAGPALAAPVCSHLGQQLLLGECGDVSKVEAKGAAQLDGLDRQVRRRRVRGGECGVLLYCQLYCSAAHKLCANCCCCVLPRRTSKLNSGSAASNPPAPPSLQCRQTGCRCLPSSVAALLPA